MTGTTKTSPALTGRPTRSGIPARGFSTTDRARRRVDHAKSYGAAQRIADNFHGWVDARHGIDQAIGDTPWVHRLQHTYNENSDRILAGTRDALAEQVTHLQATTRDLKRMTDQIERWQQEHDAITAPSAILGNGERHLGIEVAAARQERVMDAKRSAAAARVASAKAERDQLEARSAELSAILLEEFGTLVVVVERMHQYYMRRLATYTRRLVTRRDNPAAWHELVLPAWTSKPCSWMP